MHVQVRQTGPPVVWWCVYASTLLDKSRNLSQHGPPPLCFDTIDKAWLGHMVRSTSLVMIEQFGHLAWFPEGAVRRHVIGFARLAVICACIGVCDETTPALRAHAQLQG